MLHRDDYGYEVEETAMGSSRSWFDRLDWTGVRHEVEAEARAEIVLMGLTGVGKSTLYCSLRGISLGDAEPDQDDGFGCTAEAMGLFTLIDLPAQVVDDDVLWEHLERATLLVYVLDGDAIGSSGDGEAGRPGDLRWLARLQALARPLMVVLNKADLWAERLAGGLEALERRVGSPVLPVSAIAGAEMRHTMLLRMVELCPALAVPLGREVIGFRKVLAQRIIGRTVLRCGLVSLEPIPLLDLPMQLAAQVGMVARIGAMYGRMPAGDHAKELVVAGAGSVLLRTAAQQTVKTVPVLGWVLSGILGGLAALTVGETALAYFDGHLTYHNLRTRSVQLWTRTAEPWLCRLRALAGNVAMALGLRGSRAYPRRAQMPGRPPGLHALGSRPRDLRVGDPFRRRRRQHRRWKSSTGIAVISTEGR